MLISVILAWITVVLCALTALRYIARISKNKAMNKFFHNIHIPFGVLFLVTGLIHGILAGNPSFATLSTISLAPVLFTLNWGTACIILAVVLLLSYVLRKKLRKNWMLVHRIATVALLICLVLHVIDVGIRLPSLLFPNNTNAQVSTTENEGNTTTQAPNDITTEQPAVNSSTDDATQDATTGSQTDTTTDTTTAPTTNNTTDAKTDTTTDANTNTTPDTATANNSATTFSGAQLKDGTYEGTAAGYNGNITVSVLVENGAVTSIDVLSNNETPNFFSRALTILSSITGSQSLEVDTISGATYSAAGLIHAVYDALQGAVISGTLQENSIDLSNTPQRGRH